MSAPRKGFEVDERRRVTDARGTWLLRGMVATGGVHGDWVTHVHGVLEGKAEHIDLLVGADEPTDDAALVKRIQRQRQLLTRIVGAVNHESAEHAPLVSALVAAASGKHSDLDVATIKQNRQTILESVSVADFEATGAWLSVLIPRQ